MFWRRSRDADSLSVLVGAWPAQPISQEQNNTTDAMSWMARAWVTNRTI